MKSSVRIGFLYSLLFLGWFSVHAQVFQSDEIRDIQTFRFRDGLDIGFIESIDFDNEGWLWISGLESESGANDFLNKKASLQRFDGLNFQTVPLPQTSETSFTGCMFFKRKDGLFFIQRTGTDIEDLFLFDPLTIEFTHIPLPDTVGVTRVAGVFPRADATFVAFDFGINTELYELTDELTFKRLFSIEREHAGDSYINTIIPFKDHFLISEERFGIYAADLNGNKIKTFDYKDLNIPIPVLYESLVIRDNFILNGKHYFGFWNEKELFVYEPKQVDFVRVDSSGNHPLIVREKQTPGFFKYVLNDGLDNFVTLKYTDREMIFSRYLRSEDYKVNNNLFESFDVINIASRNLNKELFIAELGKLKYVTFRDSPITTFLEDNSVRSIMHWQGDEYLVSGEYKGWYIINIADGTQRQVQLTSEGKPFTATSSKGMYRDDYGLWSNFGGGIMLVNPDTFEAELFREFPIWALTNTEDKLYFGAYLYPLSSFDKKTKTYQKLSKNDSLIAIDIEYINNTVYMTTDQGLFWYRDGKEGFVDFELQEGGFMMLEKHDSLKLLVTTTLGDVYQFDPKTEAYSLIYEHEMVNPIASILTADDGKLWMNTFTGVISLDLKTGNEEHFLEEDGLSNNEGNRYSQIKTKDGGFLFGSIRGLNYLHPEKMSKAPIDAELKLTSLTRFSKSSESNTIELAPSQLSKIKRVSLPAENPYLKVEVAPARLISSINTNIQYRLNESEWQTLYNSGSIELINLAAGTYELEVRLVSTDLSPIGAPLLLNIDAREFFYKTSWFITLVILIILIVSYYFIRQANRARKLEQDFSRSLLTVQEGERSRISRELHDSVGQQLILLKNQAKASDNQEILETATDTLEEVRSITRDLHPAILTQLGLTAALEDLINKLDKSSEIFFTSEFNNIDGLFGNSQALNIYRIVQELLNNLIKHSAALSARIEVRKANDKVTIIVEDNGVGFSLEEKYSKSESLGLKTIHERANMLKAMVQIDSGKSGSKFSVEIPVLTK